MKGKIMMLCSVFVNDQHCRGTCSAQTHSSRQ